jgi:hypothetical protein
MIVILAESFTAGGGGRKLPGGVGLALGIGVRVGLGVIVGVGCGGPTRSGLSAVRSTTAKKPNIMSATTIQISPPDSPRRFIEVSGRKTPTAWNENLCGHLVDCGWPHPLILPSHFLSFEPMRQGRSI